MKQNLLKMLIKIYFLTCRTTKSRKKQQNMPSFKYIEQWGVLKIICKIQNQQSKQIIVVFKKENNNLIIERWILNTH